MRVMGDRLLLCVETTGLFTPSSVNFRPNSCYIDDFSSEREMRVREQST